ncbi:MAG: SGNH/GDSL hydrolase family protein [Gammaproteobacteria bacterium]
MNIPDNSRKQNLLLMLASMFVTLLLLEVAARIWLNKFMSEDDYRRYVLYTDVPTKDRQWSPHHYLNYYPTPDYKHGLTRHNSLGYRDREIDVTKDHNTLRIIAIGGSTTYTIKVEDNNQTFSAQLEKILRNKYDYENVEVINAGVGGYNSWESLTNLQYRVLDLEPNLIIIYHGVNDVHTRLVPHAAYRSDNSGRRKQWDDPPIAFWEHSALLRIISRKLHLTRQVTLGTFVDADTYHGSGNRRRYQVTAKSQMKMLKDNSPVFFERNLENMISISRQHGAEALLVTFAHSPETDDGEHNNVYEQGYKENNSVVREVAKEFTSPMFDLARDMPQDRKYWADSVHVNEAGALLKAELIARFIHHNNLINPDSTDSN